LPDAEIADPVAGQAEDVFAAKQNMALRRAMNAGDRANKRCFARTIGADDGDDGALFDVETATMRSLSVGRNPAITSSSRSSRGPVASARATSRRFRSGSASAAAIRFRCS